MIVPLRQLDKARARLTFDPVARQEAIRERTPRELTTAEQQAARGRFLAESLGDPVEARQTLERVLNGNELQPVNYLARGAVAARAVGRIHLRGAAGETLGWGTGFFIAPGVLLTNHHVLGDAAAAGRAQAHFAYETDMDGRDVGPVIFRLEPQRLFHACEPLDFAVVAVAPQAEAGGQALAEYGFLPLLPRPGKALDGEWLTIIQHPQGQRKQLCVRENRLLKRTDEVLWYSTDTLPGSSGSPVLNNDWLVVALHHSGVPEKQDGVIQTTTGRPYDPRTTDESEIKWTANEGIRASRICAQLEADLPGHPLLLPLFGAGIAPQPPAPLARGDSAALPFSTQLHTTAMNPNPATQTITIPLHITLQVAASGAAVAATVAPAGTREAFAIGAERRRPAAPPVEAAVPDVQVDPNYANRKGYKADFLGKGAHEVQLPALDPALAAQATLLIGSKTDYVLPYNNFSVVMHAKRRFCIYSAANVRFDQRFAQLQGRRDRWVFDPRIPREAQVDNSYYVGNQFDRGHLTRREDMEWGRTMKKALQAAADTLHWTNAAPQHSAFNQTQDWWQGLERHLLENAISENQFSAQVITGPIFDLGDPEYRGLPYPLAYWKVVAAINGSGNLFAAAFLISQKEVIDEHGIEVAPEIPFTDFKGFQLKITEIERLTGLSFTSGAGGTTPLSAADPMRNQRHDAPHALPVAEAMIL